MMYCICWLCCYTVKLFLLFAFFPVLRGKKNVLKSVFCEKWLPRAAVRSVESVSHLPSVWLLPGLPLWVCLESVEAGQVCPDVPRCAVWRTCSWGCDCVFTLWREVTLVLRATKQLPLACSTDRTTHSSFPKNASLTVLKCFSDTVLDGFPNSLTPLQKYLCLIDVGYFINTSGAALFKPERNVDVIISLDYGLGHVFKVRRLTCSALCRVKLFLSY